MDIYKTALSALLIAPIVGGIGIHTIKQYQAMKEKAEEISTISEERVQELEAMLEGEFSYDAIEECVFLENGFDEEELEESTLGVNDISESIANEVIRFHVRANSDSEEDQALKLQVRDAILEELGTELEKAESKDEARKVMEDNLEKIEKIGAEIIEEAGYDYEIDAYLTVEEFPMKSYGDLMFPAGEYEALRVDIGTHEGGNWWCVMYPGLCFVDTVGGVVATDGKEELQRVLTPEEYEELLICPSEDTQIEYRSLLWDSLFENE